MRRSRHGGAVAAVFVLALLFAGGCGRRPAVRPPAEAAAPGRTEVVVASWYGPKFHGKQTASGERYDMEGFTAAHKELPFGTRLRVTYLKTGRSTEVVVNDRGPFVRGRSLDLSRAAARAVGLLSDGTGRVRITVLGRDKRYIRRIRYRDIPETPGTLTVQVGAFADKGNAERLKTGLALTYPGVYLEEAVVDGRTFYRVRIGRYENRFDAYTRARQLAGEGYAVRVVTATPRLP